MTPIEKLSLSERVCYSTLRIEASIPPSSISTGTGFLFNFQIDENKYIPCLVTNKHVIEGSTATSIEISYEKGGEMYHEPISISTSFWILHPNPDVDLCLLPIQLLYNILVSQGKTPYVIPMDESIIPSQEQLEALSAIEDIVMIGYPDGIWDQVNNQPIIRKGITATHPCKDFNGKKEFLIDAACFPGSSGSPIMVLNQGGFVDKKGNLNWGASRVMLLGVLYAGPVHTAEGKIAFAAIPKAYTSIPNNLGIVIKSSRIMEFKALLLAIVSNELGK